jgi:hypothetical protein
VIAEQQRLEELQKNGGVHRIKRMSLEHGEDDCAIAICRVVQQKEVNHACICGADYVHLTDA